jgi:hypothetical protein
MTAVAGVSGRVTPYKGLTQYTEDDAPFFFGREEETRLIASNLLASRLTLLYGPTGVGKSSLLAAGVKRHLDDRARNAMDGRATPDWVTVVFPSDRMPIGPRRDSWREDPLDALAAAIEDAVAAAGAPVSAPPRAPDLVTLLNAWTERLDAELMLILDQFEEYFLYHGDEDGEGTLAADLPRVIGKPGMGVNVLISIREDAYAQLDRFKGRIPDLYENYLRLGHLTRDRARLAITGPVEEHRRRGGRMEIDDDLVEAVLTQVQSGAVVLGQSGHGTVEGDARAHGIETPFLQLVMERLWLRERELGSDRLRLATLEQLGGAASIVRTHLDGALSSFSPADQEIAARVFGRLVTPSGTKIASLASDLAASEGLAPEDVSAVLDRLADLRVLRTIAPVMGERLPRYEIFHDVLAPAVLDWRGRWLRGAEQRRLEQDLADQEARLRRERAAARRFRIVAAVAAVLAVLSVLAALIALDRTREADKRKNAANAAKQQAVASKQIADAAADLDRHPATALQVAAHALPNGKGPESAVRLLRAALRIPTPLANLAPAAGTVRDAVFSSDGMYVVTLADRRIDVWSGYEGRHYAGADAPPGPRTVAFSPDDTEVLTSTGRGVTVWRWLAHAAPAPLAAPGRVLAAGFAAGGRRIAAVTTRGVYLWRADRPGPVHTWRVSGATVAAVSPSGDRAVVGTKDGARVVDLRSLASRRLRWPAKRSSSRATRAVAFSRDGRVLAMASDVAVGRRGGRGAPAEFAAAAPAAAAPAAAAVSVGPAAAAAPAPAGPVVSPTRLIGMWDAASGHLRATATAGESEVTSVAVDAHGQRVAFGSADGTARTRTLEGDALFAAGSDLRGHTGQVITVAYSRDGDLIVTGSADGDARVWTASGTPLATLHGGGEWVQAAPSARTGGDCSRPTGRQRICGGDRRHWPTTRSPARAPSMTTAHARWSRRTRASPWSTPPAVTRLPRSTTPEPCSPRSSPTAASASSPSET